MATNGHLISIYQIEWSAFLDRTDQTIGSFKINLSTNLGILQYRHLSTFPLYMYIVSLSWTHFRINPKTQFQFVDFRLNIRTSFNAMVCHGFPIPPPPPWWSPNSRSRIQHPFAGLHNYTAAQNHIYRLFRSQWV